MSASVGISGGRALTLSRTTSLLILILALAFALRIWGVWFGLPFLFHNDEDFEVIRALQLGAGQFDFDRIAKGGYFYVLFVEYGLLFVVLFVTGVVGSANDFAELYLKDPTAFYLLGRITTAVIGTITVYLVYRIGQLAYTRGAALIAAAFLAVNVLHSYLSHFVTVDVPMTCLAMATLYFAVKIAQGGTSRDYWWAAVFAALATTTKLPAALLLISLLIAHGYAIRLHRGGVREYFGSRTLWQAAGIFLVTYLVLTPGMLVNGDAVFRGALEQFGIGAAPVDAAAGDMEFELDERAKFANTNLFVFYLQTLINSMTLPVFLLCMAGIGYALWRRKAADVVLGSFAVATYLMVSLSSDIHQFFPRYMLPAIPILVLFGGRLLEAVMQAFPTRSRSVAALGIVALAMVAPGRDIASSNAALLQKDTRAVAFEWIEENIPAGARIFIEGNRTTLTNATVPLKNSAENIKESIEFYRGREPGRVKYFQTLLKVQTGKTYDLVGVRPFDLQALQAYKEAGVEYFVLRPMAYPGSRVQFHWEDFVEDIRSDPDLELIQRFEPDPASAPGPVIEIYRVDPVHASTHAE